MYLQLHTVVRSEALDTCAWLAHGCCMAVQQPGSEPLTCWSQILWIKLTCLQAHPSKFHACLFKRTCQISGPLTGGNVAFEISQNVCPASTGKHLPSVITELLLPRWQLCLPRGNHIHALDCKGTIMNLQEDFKVTAVNDNWLPVTFAIARIFASKPHSCDVEYLVFAYNQLKDPNRCKMSTETIDAYLNIRINMLPLTEFDIRSSVHRWVARRETIPVKATTQAWFLARLERRTIHSDFMCSDSDSDLRS